MLGCWCLFTICTLFLHYICVTESIWSLTDTCDLWPHIPLDTSMVSTMWLIPKNMCPNIVALSTLLLWILWTYVSLCAIFLIEKRHFIRVVFNLCTSSHGCTFVTAVLSTGAHYCHLFYVSKIDGKIITMVTYTICVKIITTNVLIMS